MHGHLEWRWIALTIYFYNERKQSHQNVIIRDDTITITDFEEKLLLFIYDLIVISIAKFNKVRTTNNK